MNYRIVFGIIGKAMIMEALLMLFPMLVGFIYQENTLTCFLVPIIALLAIGIPLSLIKIKDKLLYVKEGFVSVALVWIVISLFGAIPFVIEGSIPNYVDAFFETVSGFTTTGATILASVENGLISRAVMFWRVFTTFIGGMGVIVFVLAILPTDSGSMHIFRAESPGPSASKLVSKIGRTARILYLIYLGLTLIELAFLLCGGMGFYDALLTVFSNAGTGGLYMYDDSIGHFNSLYFELVIAMFMFLFGINFNVFYLILIGNVSKALASEELRAYVIMVVVSVLLIAINLLSVFGNFWTSLKYSYFQVTSIVSTTGFSSTNFGDWPAFSRLLLSLLMIVGACGGSTSGGLKVSRIVILFKSIGCDFKRILNPRAVVTPKLDKKALLKEEESLVKAHFIFWFLIVVLSVLILSLDSAHPNDMVASASSVISCIGNVGPAFTSFGWITDFSNYSSFSKILLSFLMLVGRLEIFPILILFSPRTWKRAG